MSYLAAAHDLQGSDPDPIPPANTPDMSTFTVGSYVLGFGYAEIPWLDAQLTVQGVTADQAAREVIPNITASLQQAGAQVQDAGWVAGGYVHVTFRPTSEHPAIDYATTVRDALFNGGHALGPNVQIIMPRYRINMPAGRENLYAYPTGSLPVSSSDASTAPSAPSSDDSSGNGKAVATTSGGGSLLQEVESPTGMFAMGVAGVALLGVVGAALAWRRSRLRQNRLRQNRLRRRRTRARSYRR